MTMKTELKTPRLRTFYIKQEADEDVVFTLRMARTPDGFTIYAKSKEFHDWFKNLSKNSTLGFTKAWSVNMDSYNISKLWTDRMYDDLGGQINWRDPEDYIPKTLEAGFRNWNNNILMEAPNFNPPSKTVPSVPIPDTVFTLSVAIINLRDHLKFHLCHFDHLLNHQNLVCFLWMRFLQILKY